MEFKNSLSFISVFLFANATLVGQNFGLTAPQDAVTLPGSGARIEQPVRKVKEKSITVLQPVQNNEWIIKGGWELAEASKVTASEQWLFNPEYNTSAWYNATVPGTVLTTLVNQGIYPNPYFGLNNLHIPDSLCRIDWWYRTVLRLPNVTSQKKIWLLFEGINYKADIWLNGKQLGTMKGAFTRGEFDASGFVNREGDNILAVHILPPPNPGIPHEESPSAGRGPNGGQLCLDGPTFISSEGWDWIPGIRDRNIGIWQNVLLKATDDITLKDPRIITDLPLPDTSQAECLVMTDVINNAGKKQMVTITGNIGDITFSQSVSLDPWQHRTVSFSAGQYPQLQIKNPRLWWPNGYGKPELYTLKLSATNEDKTVSDTKVVRFGIRELSYELTVDAPGKKDWRVEFNPTSARKTGRPLFDNVKRRDVGDGVSVPELRDDADPSLLSELQDKGTAPYLVIKVNGKRIFCKGGNWGMDDAMKQCSREHLEPYFRLHRDANFNMIRNWTGESTEETFYDLCDEYGLLVWNDFWLSTEGYNLAVNDDNLFLANASEVVLRFRNHPSIAVWCPRNEGYAPPYIEDGLASLIAKEDGTRYYQPNSRYLNLRPSGPWHYFKDPAEYFRRNTKGFNTEQGSPSVPTATSMRKMMPLEDVWPISDDWYYHDLHFGQVEYRAAIDSLYGKSDNLDDFCKKAQMVNYDSHRAMFESWNSKLWNNTSGLLLWMTHPAWPSTVWQVYSWDYETFGSYFGCQKACEPVHVQMNLHDNKVVIVNTTLSNLDKALVSMEILNMQGKVLYRKKESITSLSNSLTECFTPDFPAGLPGIYLLRLMLLDKNGQEISENEYWKNSSGEKNFQNFNTLPKVEPKGKVLKIQKRTRLEFVISNTTSTPAIGIKLNLRHAVTKELVLPAYFSDGYFTLLPGESKQLKVDYNGQDVVVIATSGYNVAESEIPAGKQ